MRTAIINLANGRYIKGQERLKASLAAVGFTGDILPYQSISQLKGCPDHQAQPYAFKTYAFKQAFNLGYDLVLWLDASVWAVKPVEGVFKKIEEQGYIMQEAGHYVGTWTNDRALDYFNITRDEANTMLMYGNAGLLGLSKHNAIAMEFLYNWHEAAKNGIFAGSWNNQNNSESLSQDCKGHRHDMSVGSIIANALRMKYESGNELLAYAAPEDKVNDKVIFKAQGV